MTVPALDCVNCVTVSSQISAASTSPSTSRLTTSGGAEACTNCVSVNKSKPCILRMKALISCVVPPPGIPATFRPRSSGSDRTVEPLPATTAPSEPTPTPNTDILTPCQISTTACC